MPAYPWGGYLNGRIPAHALADYRGVLVRADAAAAAYALQEAYQRATGLPLKVLEGYRNLTRQQKLRNLYLTGNGNPAAIPGTSVHGWALAFDFAAPLNNSNTSQHKWMRDNAGRYGFDWARGKADGEPWHWEYGNVKPSVAGLDTKPIEEDMALDRDDLIAILNASWKRPDGRQVSIKDALDAVFFYGDNSNAQAKEILTQLRAVWDTITPGIEGVKYDGKLYEQVKWAEQNTRALLDGGEVDEAELAARLAPLLVNNMSAISNADLDRMKKAVADEFANRLKA